MRISWPNFNQNSIWNTVSTSIFNELSGGKNYLFTSVSVFSLERVKYWQKLGFLKKLAKNAYVKFMLLIISWPNFNQNSIWNRVSTSIFNEISGEKSRLFISVLVFSLERDKYWQKLGYLKNFGKNAFVKFHAFENILAKFQPKYNLKHSFY